MKLLILSDSHGEQEFMQLAVRRERPDAVIHLGDHCADADRLAEEFCGLPVLSVRGNCDLWGPPRAETLLRTFEGGGASGGPMPSDCANDISCAMEFGSFRT